MFIVNTWGGGRLARQFPRLEIVNTLLYSGHAYKVCMLRCPKARHQLPNFVCNSIYLINARSLPLSPASLLATSLLQASLLSFLFPILSKSERATSGHLGWGYASPQPWGSGTEHWSLYLSLASTSRPKCISPVSIQNSTESSGTNVQWPTFRSA